jgi:hypothetical protein
MYYFLPIVILKNSPSNNIFHTTFLSKAAPIALQNLPKKWQQDRHTINHKQGTKDVI